MCQSSSANDECDESDGIWLLKTYVAAVCYQFGNFKGLRGQGVPWDHIMDHEFEYISDRGGHLAEKFFEKNIVPIPSYRGYRVAICLSLLGNSRGGAK